jgi:hypothetical protein
LRNQKRTEEELKAEILNLYCQYHEESSSDRRQVYYGRLCELVYSWCRDHIYKKEADEMGVEIAEAVINCVEKDKMSNEVFIKYLRESLNNAYLQFLRKKVEGPLKITRKIKDIKKLINSEEKERGGKELTEDECIQCISDWLHIDEKKARDYVERMDRIFISNTCADGDNNNDIVDSIESHYLKPQDEIFAEEEVMLIKDALEAVLSKSKKKKPFRRALLTWRCIEYFKDYEKFLPVLDVETIEDYKKNGVIPNQFEIYMKCYPDAKESTAKANASDYKNEFFENLYDIVKEKYPGLNKFLYQNAIKEKYPEINL